MFILYASDFHFSANSNDFDKAKDKLKKLGDLINKDYSIDVFVFAGDLIDAKSISLKTAQQFFSAENEDNEKYDEIVESINNQKSIDVFFKNDDEKREYYDTIEKNTNELFDKVKDVLNSFLETIGITDKKKVILCCGNHDIFRFKNSTEFVCNNGKGKDTFDNQKYSGNYSSFSKFNSDMNIKTKEEINSPYIKKANEEINSPYIKIVGNYSFLIIDSNIVNEHNKSCIQCKNIMNLLDKLDIKSKSKNIAISHKPFFDCCENVLINYEKSEQKPIANLIAEKCSLVLFGDKHGQYKNKLLDSKELLCGSPLCEDNISYYILKTNDNADGSINEFKKIRWYKDDWYYLISDIETVINSCKDYFSPLTNGFIGDINIENILKINFEDVEQLFECMTHIKWLNKYIGNSFEKTSFSFKDVFGYLMNAYKNENDQYSKLNLFNLRGRPSTGKTFLTNCLFCYLLIKFYLCTANFVPMYFSLEPIKNLLIKSYDEYYERAKNEFDSFLKNCSNISQLYNTNVLCIIDGLEEKNCYYSKIDQTNIETYIVDTLNDCGKYKYILAFEQTVIPLATDNIPRYKLMCDYVYYLRRLDIVNLYSYENNSADPNFRNAINNTLEAFFKICPYKSNDNNLSKFVEDLLESLSHLHLTNINYMFLRNNIAHLSNNNPQNYKNYFNNLIDILETRHSKIYSGCKNLNTDGLYPVAYNYYINGLTYDKLKEKYDINFNTFYEIKKDEELLQYLTAIHYINTMQKMSNSSDEELQHLDTSIFSCFITRNISLMMRWYIARNGLSKIVDNFINFIFNKDIPIHYQLKSTLFYLIGFLDLNRLFPLVDMLKTDETIDPLLGKELAEFNAYCVEHSKKIANIVCCKDDQKQQDIKKDFFDKLFYDNQFREMNRVYQSLYYGDNTLLGYNGKPFYPTKDIIYKGWDFHNTFLTLISKFDYSYNKKSYFKDYVLFDYDLFTLCDIVYNRLQNSKTYDSQISMYYNKNYNTRAAATLYRLSDALSKAINTNIFRGNYQLYDYFNAMKNLFTDIAHKISELPHKSTTESTPESVSEPASESTTQTENANDNIFVAPYKLLDDFWKSSPQSCMSTNECAFSLRLKSVYTALFFLPNEKEAEQKYGDLYCNYNKNLIISLLLLNDIPNDPSAKEINNILAMGEPCGFGNLTEYFNCLRSQKSDTFNINLAIAKDINFIVEHLQQSSRNIGSETFSHISKICEPIYETLILKKNNETHLN